MSSGWDFWVSLCVGGEGFSPPEQGLEQGDQFFRAHSYVSSWITLLLWTGTESSWMTYLYIKVERVSLSFGMICKRERKSERQTSAETKNQTDEEEEDAWSCVFPWGRRICILFQSLEVTNRFDLLLKSLWRLCSSKMSRRAEKLLLVSCRNESDQTCSLLLTAVRRWITTFIRETADLGSN